MWAKFIQSISSSVRRIRVSQEGPGSEYSVVWVDGPTDPTDWTMRIHLTHLLSGYGVISADLIQMGIKASPRCYYCLMRRDRLDSQFSTQQREENLLTKVRPNKVVPLMLISKDNETRCVSKPNTIFAPKGKS